MAEHHFVKPASERNESHKQKHRLKRRARRENINRKDSLLKPALLTSPVGHAISKPRKEVRFKSPEKPRARSLRKQNIHSPKAAGVVKAKKRSDPFETANNKLNARFRVDKSKKEAKAANSTGVEEHEKKTAKLHSRQYGKGGRKARPEHPLYMAFETDNSDHGNADATLAYEAHLKAEGPKALDAAVKTVYARLEAVDLATSNLIETYKESVRPLERDFKDEKLHLTLDAGTSKEKKINVTIGERVEAFSAFIRTQSRKADELLGQWKAMTEELEKLKAGFCPLEGTDGEEAAEGYMAQARKLQKEYHAQREQILKTFDEECAKLEKKASDSEKSYEAALAKQRNTLLQYLQLETEMRDADEDMDEEEDADQRSEEDTNE